MSSSEHTPVKRWGTIFTGPDPAGEHTLAQLEGSRNSPRWDEKTEVEYLARVRARAEKKARDILSTASQQADALRQEAHRQGYEEGMAQARQELEDFRAATGDSVAAVLGAIRAQCTTVFDSWRSTLIALLRTSVQRAVGMHLSQERNALLEAMFSKAAEALDNRRVLTIRCNPEDAPAVEDIVAAAKERMPELKRWNVLADNTVQPGGLSIDNNNGMAQSTPENRLAILDEILSQVELPATPPEHS